MGKIRVVELVGDIAITIDDGQILYDQIMPCLAKNEKVVLDFEGVEIIASPFLNFGIGQLYNKYTSDQLQKLLKIENFPVSARGLLIRVIENSKEYYSNEAYRKAVDEVMAEKVESL
jgi:STAS-like domain of unknown function (DUF4325)